MSPPDFSDAAALVRQWVGHGFYPGAALLVGRGEEIVLFQRRLAQPLGLTHTRFTPVDSGPGHTPLLAGSARSSARDYMRFLALVANGGRFGGKRLLSESVVEEMERDQVREARVPPGEFVERARGSRHGGVYGLGLWRERVDADGRALQVSSPSWAGTYPWIDRQRGVYGVLVAHVDTSGPRWERGFDPYYSSAAVADRVGAAFDRAGSCGNIPQ